MCEVTKTDFWAHGGESNEMQFSTMVQSSTGEWRVAYFRYFDGQ